jgi:excisionase family DNA binding protein
MSLPETFEIPPMKRPRGRPRGSKNKNRRLYHPDPQIALTDTINEFCAKVKCSRIKAYRMMQAGTLRYAQIGGQRRIPHTEYQRLGVIP